MSQMLAEAGFDQGSIYEFGKELALSQWGSIDRFIENRNEWSDIGKAAIAAALIPREMPAEVVQPKEDERVYEYIWLQMGPTIDYFMKCGLSIVTFNYDRSFEFFFLNALTYGFGVPVSKAEEVFRSTVPIVHVYGQVNSLQYGGSDGMPYGAAAHARNINAAAASIELVAANRATSDRVRAAQKLIASAEVVFFLGFGYDQINLERLGLATPLSEKKYLGTAYGLESGQQSIVKSFFAPRGGITLGHAKTDAHTFLREHADILVSRNR